MTPYYADPLVTLYLGDCLEVMPGLEADSVDAVVTDPPYNLSFMSKSWDAFGGREDAGFAYWLAGLIDGEGHFAIKKHSRGTHAPAFQLKMRADERGTLEQIRRHTGIGSITEEQRDGNPMVKWMVQDKEGCKRLVDLLDKYPLRAKKRQDYNIWREAVCEWAERGRGNRWHGAVNDDRMASLRGRLMKVRNYVEPAWSGHEFQDWTRLWALEAFRILKPGGYLLSFGGTRQYHRMTAGIEDAGFEIRDTLQHIYASGFPKGKANLKPAHEPIVMARKPLVGSVAANVTRYGTGAINVDACRIEARPGDYAHPGNDNRAHTATAYNHFDREGRQAPPDPAGRWPSNVLLSSPELFDEPNPEVVGSGATSESASGVQKYQRADTSGWKHRGGVFKPGREWEAEGYGDSGGYSRFFRVPSRGTDMRSVREDDGGGGDYPTAFLIPKAGREERNRGLAGRSSHPTVKPIDLMRHLVRLVTPTGGTILDPFLGSGTTALAASEEGFRCIGIEREPEYLEIAKGRLMATPMGLGLDVPAGTKRRSLPTDEKLAELAKTYPGQIFPYQREPDEEPAA